MRGWFGRYLGIGMLVLADAVSDAFAESEALTTAEAKALAAKAFAAI